MLTLICIALIIELLIVFAFISQHSVQTEYAVCTERVEIHLCYCRIYDKSGVFSYGNIRSYSGKV